MIKNYSNEKIVVVLIYCKVKCTPKTIQMIMKLDEILNHILNELIVTFQLYF
jgi:hypothetical protein